MQPEMFIRPSEPVERLSAAVHDLKNPVCSILNLTEVLLNTPFATLTEETLHSELALIQKLSWQINTLTNEILPSSGAWTPEAAICKSVEDLLLEAAALWRPLASEHGILIAIRPVPQDCQVRIELSGLLRVFSNLIGNAIRFSPAESTITLSAEKQHAHVLFKVEDMGSGIRSEHLERIFEKHWQADPRSSAGAGLGLTISRQIITAHGGRIWAEAAPGGTGSHFCFTLPLQ